MNAGVHLIKTNVAKIRNMLMSAAFVFFRRTLAFIVLFS